MSDSPEGPNWWQATDGRWYPPEQFTGPPELRPGGDEPAHEAPTEAPDEAPAEADRTEAPDEAPAEADRTEDGSTARPRGPVIAIGVAVLVVVALGAWLLLRNGGGDDEQAADDTVPGLDSASEGPVRIAGAIRIESSVSLGDIAPTDCDGWRQLLRVEIQTPAGAPITTFAPEVVEPAEEERTEEGRTLTCALDYRAQVPTDDEYVVTLRNVRDLRRPAFTQTIEGAEKGDVEVPDATLSYTCDPTNGCLLRPTG